MRDGCFAVTGLGLSLFVGCSGGGTMRGDAGASVPRDAAGTDAGSAARVDAAAVSDGGGLAADAGLLCGALGGPHMDVGCARSSGGFTTELAFMLDDEAAPRLRILGFGLGGVGACSVADHVQVTTPLGVTLASFDAGGEPLALGNGGWLEGDATAAAIAFCASDDDRFDAVRLELTGRSEGANFTATCGGPGIGGGWPPSLVITCHRGLPPSRPSTLVTIEASRTSVQTWTPSAHAVTVTAIDPMIEVVSATYGGGSPTTRTIGGWSLSFWTPAMGTAGAVPFEYGLQIAAPGDVLGPLCVPRGGMPPAISPAHLFRLTGTTATAPFSTELYLDACIRP